MQYKIKEVAKITGVTVRTLQYYDKIGLLPPAETNEKGYRLYDENSLGTIAEILFFRELDFPLAEIKAIMNAPGYSRQHALERHRDLLIEKNRRLEGLIDMLDDILEGEKMSFEKFDMKEIEAHKEQYKQEVEERWGDSDAYKESTRRANSYNSEDWERITAEQNEIMQAFGDMREGDPGSDDAQALVARWQAFITNNFYECSNEILAGLGQMYIADPRFTKNIDNFGAGTAAFKAKAIEIYCKNK